MGKRLVVIGGTAAGLSAATKAKRSKPELGISVYEKTGYVSYGSCGLPYFIGGKIEKPDDLVALSVEQLRDKRNISTYIHHEVTKINRDEKTVEVINLTDGKSFVQPYDYLVIATGSRPIIPPLLPDAKGIYTLRSVEDGIAIKSAIQNGAKRAIIVGAGFIGLESAEALTEAGIQVTLIEALPRLLPVLQEEYAYILLKTLQSRGVQVRLNTTVEEIIAEKGHVTGIKTSDGAIVNADFILLSIGSAPNTALAENCGLELGIKKGIVVNQQLQTSDPSIWASGDCVQMFHLLTGEPCYVPLGTTANKQGRIAGENITEGSGAFKGVLSSQVTKVFDQYVASTGLTVEQAKKAGFDALAVSIIKGDKASYYPGSIDSHITLVFNRKDGRLLGAQGIGGFSIAGRINVLIAAISKGMTVEELNDLDLVYSPSVAPVYDPLLIAAAQALKQVKK